jgi:hypothetical protein
LTRDVLAEYNMGVSWSLRPNPLPQSLTGALDVTLKPPPVGDRTDTARSADIKSV